jgi:hypothetical protein
MKFLNYGVIYWEVVIGRIVAGQPRQKPGHGGASLWTQVLGERGRKMVV